MLNEQNKCIYKMMTIIKKIKPTMQQNKKIIKEFTFHNIPQIAQVLLSLFLSFFNTFIFSLLGVAFKERECH